MSVTFFQPPNKKYVDNREYRLGNLKLNGNPIYFKFYRDRKRISTNVGGLIGGITNLLFHNLQFQAYNDSGLTGDIQFIPYIFNNQGGVIIKQINGGYIQIQATNSAFAGNYEISGLMVYTKPE